MGGVNQVVYRLFKRAEQGTDIRPLLLVTSWNAPPHDDRIDCDSQFHVRLNSLYEGNWILKEFIGFFLGLPINLWRLSRLLRTRGIRVVNPHYPTLACLHFALLKRLQLYRGKLILTLQGAEIADAARSRGIKRLLWLFMLRSADKITACSEALASVAVDFDASLSRKIVAIHNAADEADSSVQKDNIREALSLSPSDQIVLNVGKFEHKKGQDVLLAAFKMLVHIRPRLRLVMVGARGPALESMRSKIRAEGLEAMVRLCVDVPHPRIWSYLREASVFVLSSRKEPFGIVVLEAGLAQVPVVACAVGGVPEIIVDGKNGILVPPDDPAAAARAIAQLLDDPNEGHQMARQLRHEVITRFSWENCYQRFLDAAGLRKRTSIVPPYSNNVVSVG